MSVFLAHVEMTAYLALEIEAETEEEAYEKAKQADGSEFYENGYNWRLTSVDKV